MSRAASSVGVVAALDLEAKALQHAWNLERTRSGPFVVYRGVLPVSEGTPKAEVKVLVSGVGKVAAAAGTAWLAASANAEAQCEAGLPRIWLNFGVAGAGTLQGKPARLGQVVIAARVIDEERRRLGTQTRDSRRADESIQVRDRVPTWYPPWLLSPTAGSDLAVAVRSTVRTVDRPEALYADDGAYEMEAAGFCATASRFALAELVQVVKVVSDSPTQSLSELNRARLAECARAGVGVLTELATQLVAVSCQIDSGMQSALSDAERKRREQLGLTVAQTHLWRRQIERLEALLGVEQGAQVIERLQATERKQALRELAAAVDEHAVSARAERS